MTRTVSAAAVLLYLLPGSRVGTGRHDANLAARRVHTRGDVKSEDSDRILVIDQATADVLKAWRKTQLAERMAWAGVWTDSGRVFTREDGTPLRPGWVSERFDTLSSYATSAFTADVYTEVAEELAEAAASAIRRSSPAVPRTCQQGNQ